MGEDNPGVFGGDEEGEENPGDQENPAGLQAPG